MTEETSWQSGKTLSECINYMLLSEVATDVTFIVEGSEVKAHKFILISRSRYYETMFTGLMSEQEDPMSGQRDIPIPDISKETFNDFLRYLYTDDIVINIDNVVDILRVADKYMVKILVQKCHAFIEDNLDADNVCRIRERCHSFPNEKLLADCRRVEEESTCNVLKSAEFTYLCSSCVEELISSDSLAVDEEVVYEAVIRWAREKCIREQEEVTDDNRRKWLGNLIYHVRFPVMDASYFCRYVFPHSVLSNDELVKLHRYIHRHGESNLVTEVHHDTGISESHTHKECCPKQSNLVTEIQQDTGISESHTHKEYCWKQLNQEHSSWKSDDIAEANQSNLKQGKDVTERHRICGFDCNYRVGFRKGQYTLVKRQKSTSSVIGTKTMPVDEHFQTTSLVYLHGIKIPFRADRIIVSVNNEVVRSEVADGDPEKVLFRKIIQIDPFTDTIIHVEVNNMTDVQRHTWTKDMKFDNVTVTFTESGNGCNGCVSGLFLSK